MEPLISLENVARWLTMNGCSTITVGTGTTRMFDQWSRGLGKDSVICSVWRRATFTTLVEVQQGGTWYSRAQVFHTNWVIRGTIADLIVAPSRARRR